MPRPVLPLSLLLLAGLAAAWFVPDSSDPGPAEPRSEVVALHVHRLGKGWSLERKDGAWLRDGSPVSDEVAMELLQAAEALIRSPEPLDPSVAVAGDLGFQGAALEVTTEDAGGARRGLLIGDRLPVSPGRYAVPLSGGPVSVVPEQAVSAVDVDPASIGFRP